jgi:mono/diheme cytochrome c family protein
MRLSANKRKYRNGVPAFLAVAGLATAFAVAGSVTANADPVSDHQQAVGALTDIQSAIKVIANVEDATTSGPASYKDVAQSAINALVGRQDEAFNAQVANPGDSTGAIGHVNQLLDRESNPPWVPDLHGVLVNSQAAVSRLQDAMASKDLDSYELAASQALADLEIAEGRPSEYGALGGMVGAIANTELAVTDAAGVENGCAAPQRAGFGVYQGYLAFRAVPVTATLGAGIDNPGGTNVRRQGGMLLFYSAAAPLVRQLCSSPHADAALIAPHNVVFRTGTTQQAPSPLPIAPHNVVFRTGAIQQAPSPLLMDTADDQSGAPALYTMQQAQAGAAVYGTTCASCHGSNLQGVAAPAIAGKDFQKTAIADKYTVSIIRTIVTQNMPLSNPGSLSDPQYADIMAYLLASNCYPAGTTPFPTQDTPALATVTMGPPAHPSGTPDANGVCQVH